MSSSNSATLLLEASRGGDPRATDELLPRVYAEMRAIAEHMMRLERRDHTLQATAVVHEAYLRLINQTRANWEDEVHFRAVAAHVIRRILVDHARTRGRLKRGGDREKLTLTGELASVYEQTLDLLDLEDALSELGERNAMQAQIVEMRFFSGLTVEQVASELSVSISSVEREWRYARAWLYRKLKGNAS